MNLSFAFFCSKNNLCRYVVLLATLVAAPPLWPSSSSENQDLPCLFFFYGPPGSGKDSFCAMIRHEFGLPSIHPGESGLLSLDVEKRIDIEEIPPIGHSMPEDILPTILCNRLLNEDCAKGALIEDICLTPDQLLKICKTLGTKFQCLGIAINTDANFLVLKKGQRMFCKSCGSIYTLPHDTIETCEYCNTELSIRNDDKPEVIREKFANYTKKFEPALRFFKERHLLTEFEASQEFFENENLVRCFVLLKTHICPNKNNPVRNTAHVWNQEEKH
jgi:adenylate kinase